METVASVLLSIDLKDAYFQIPVHQSVKEAIEVPVGRDSLSVQGSMFQTVDCHTGFHPGVCHCVCMGALPRDSSSLVPG